MLYDHEYVESKFNLRLSNVQILLVSEQQNLSSTEGWSPQSLRFSFPKTAGTNALLGVCTEPLQLLDFSGDFIQSVIEQTADKTYLVKFQIFMANHEGFMVFPSGV
jgi:hypothetical protein